MFSSSAFQTGMLFTKSGVVSRTGASLPFSTTSSASFFTPAFASTSLSRTPFQRAFPIAPYAHSIPATCGSDRPRRLPEQRQTAASSTCSRPPFVRSSNRSVTGFSTASPPISSFQASRLTSGTSVRW